MLDHYHSAPCGYVTISSDWTILETNDTLLKWLELKREDVVDKILFTDLLDMGGKIYFETHMLPLLHMDGKVSEINLDLKGKGKIRIPSLIYADRIDDKSGRTIFYRISVIDISQRKLFEKELIIARKEAEETTRKLKQINQELERFAFMASHDLQAPLNTILSMVQLIERRKLLETGSKTEEMFSFIVQNTNRMRTMIKDLLSYSKLEVRDREFKPVSLNEACSQALEFLSDEIKLNDAVLKIPDLPVVSGIRTHLVRLFQNLFSNSIKYRSDIAPYIIVSCEDTGKFFTIRIADNGTGFDQKHEHKIFEFMERLHSDEFAEGTGIGLSSCKKIVEMHGGHIGVQSAPGKGSTFYFTIPKEQEPPL